jgi:outer membrane cobalamin receptor
MLLLVSALPSGAFAQVVVTGTITDPSGAVVPDVTVDARTGSTHARTSSSQDGRFVLQIEGEGEEIEISFFKPGFETKVVRVRPSGASETVNVTLEVGALAESTIVTATLRGETTSRLTGSVTSFDETEIRARGSRSLSEILQHVPGLQIEATGREGALTSLFSRGGESDYNLVLIDGVRVTLPGGRFDFGRVDANQIERVEIVRGAQSALYGSEAIGAVVQVFTRSPRADAPPRLFGSIDLGSFSTVRGSGGFGTGIARRGHVSVGGSYRGTDGAFEDILPEKDRFDQTSFDLSGGARLGGGFAARGSMRYGRSRGRSVGQVAYGLYDTGTFYDTRDLSVGARLEHTVRSWFRHEAGIGIFDYDNSTGDRVADGPWSFYAILEGTLGAKYPNSPRLVRQVSRSEFDTLRQSNALPPGQFLASRSAIFDFPFSSRMDAERRSLHYRADLSWSPALALTAGYDFDAEKDPNIEVVKRHNHAYFVQLQVRPAGRWFLTAGARLDDNSRYGMEWSPKLALGGFLVPFRRGMVSSVKLQGNAGHGIKNPVFAELFSVFVDGNPNLKPERANTFDGGLEVTLADQRLAVVATAFANRYKDQVAYRPSGPGQDGIPDYVNVEGSRADGFELEFRLQRPVAGFRASAFYTYVDSEVTTTVSTSEQFQPGQPLLRRPQHSANVFATWSQGKLTINGSVRYVGRRHDSAFLYLTTVPRPGGTPTSADITVNPGYVVLSVNGELRIGRALGLYGRLDNLADREYESALGFPGLPRSVSAGFRFDLSGRR